MVVQYVEDFQGLDGKWHDSKVATDCSSIRLVPDCGGMVSAIFLYRDNDQHMIIPFSGRDVDKKMEYLDNNVLSLHFSAGVIDLSGFKAVKMSKYIDLNTTMKTVGMRFNCLKDAEMRNISIDARDVVKDICYAIEYNDDGFEQLFKTIKEGYNV